MSLNNNVILTPSASYHPAKATPLRDGADISWSSLCRVGDDQGNSHACTIFAFANWVEVMTGELISDKAAIDVWKKERMRINGNLDGGLSIPAAWYACHKAGWLAANQTVERVQDLSTLDNAPLIACYRTTQGWHHTNKAGCIRRTDTEITGYHTVLLVDKVQINTATKKMVWIENSWGIHRGYKGFFSMTEDYHRKYCKELWRIRT